MPTKRKPDVGITLLIGSGIGSKGSDGLVFFSCDCLGELRLYFIYSSRNRSSEVLAAQGCENISL